LNCAYEAEYLTDQLEQAAREFVNAPSKNSLTPSKITISKIFKWFKSDFPKEDAFITYLNTYSTVKILSDVKINFQTYNWSLNE
jgi:quinolinate synthase